MVDDHALSRDLFCKVLTSAGYAVRVALDGLTAIRHMEERRFDAVLTDISMPHMDGLELLAETRDRWPESRVVVHSNLLTWRVVRLAKVEGHMPVSPSLTTPLSSLRQERPLHQPRKPPVREPVQKRTPDSRWAQSVVATKDSCHWLGRLRGIVLDKQGERLC